MKQNKNLEDLFFHFAMVFSLTSAKEKREGTVGFLTRMAGQHDFPFFAVTFS